MDFITTMRKRILTSGALLGLLFFLACSDPQGFKKPEDALDAGREFVRAVLDGNYEKAEMYILPEKDDLELFARYRAHMLKQTEKDKRSLKEANIVINKVEPVNDTVSIVNFQNSWSNKPADLKVVQRDGNWYIDFKYTFSGDDALK